MASPTKQFLYGGQLYRHMLSEASQVEIAPGHMRTVWRGPIVETCLKIGIPEGVYRRVTKTLELTGSIIIVEKGRRNTPTVLTLEFEPSVESWTKKSSPQSLTTVERAAMLQARVERLEKLLGGVDVIEALANLEGRLAQLEQHQQKES